MKKKYWLFFILIGYLGVKQLHAQQRSIYKEHSWTEAELKKRKAISEWKSTNRLTSALPKGIDNSTSKYFPPIFNQRSNSCSQASGVRYVFTYEVNRMLNHALAAEDNEYIFSYHFTWDYLNNGQDEGSLPELGYDLMKVAGAASKADMPDESEATSTTTWMNGYDKYLRALRFRVKSYEKFTLKTQEGIERLKQFLYNRGVEGSAGGLVTFSCKSANWTEHSYTGTSAMGLEDIITKNGTEGAHALTICGYDDQVEYDLDQNGIITEDEKGAFIIVNSWSTGWASKGRCYYPYKLFLTPANEGGLKDLDAEALMIEPEVHTPQIVFKVNVTYTSRDDLYFVLGAADGADATVPTVKFMYPIMCNQGGDYPMRGEGSSDLFKKIEVGLDFTDMIPEIESFKSPKYFLTVRKIASGSKIGDGKIDSFSVIDYRTNKEIASLQKDVPIKGETIVSTLVDANSVSSSFASWLYNEDNVIASPFILKTADGKQIKIKFEDFNKENQTVRIRYQKLQ